MNNRLSVWKVAALICAMLLASCATISSIPLFRATVQAVDDANVPIAGASVETSDGQRTTTGPDGTATLKFSSMGVHQVTVLMPNRAPASFSISMPMDSGKTFPAHLGKTMAMGGAHADVGASAEVDVNASAGANVGMSAGANMGGGMGGGMYMAALYPVIFQSMFTAYGYNMELVPFKPGEWTEWNYHSGKKKEMVMRKAFLTKLDNGQEWWQVQMSTEKKKDALAFEVLFSKERQSIRRMRQKSGEGKAAEVPVSEGWYTPPMQLTPESIEGSVTAKGEKVTVPAGDFKADLLEFAYMGSDIRVRMWRVKSVPGGVVKVELVGQGDKPLWVSELKSYGSGAKTALGSY